jgi:hypothetical protein
VERARGFSAVACPTSTLCVAVDVAGDVATSAAPAGGADAWTITHVDDGDTYECDHYDLTGPECQPALLAVSCGSQTLCAAGRLLIGNRLPPPAQLRALLRRHLSPFGRAARIGSLLARGTYAFSFAVPVSGRLTMAWDAPLRGRRASPLVARGAAQLETPGKVRIRLELTRAGRRLLRDSSRLTLIATATLRQAGGPVIRARRGFTLRR